jgi:gluconolactonase
MIRHVIDGLDHPECVTWDPRGFLYAGGEAGQLYRISPDSGAFEQLCTTEGWILGICLDCDGNAYLCDPTNHALFRASRTGELELVSNGTKERPMQIPNFAVFDSNGNLYVSDSGTWDSVSGCVFRITPEGVTTVWSSGTPNFTNGLAVDASEQYLYVVESTLPGVSRIPINSDGSAGVPEIVVSMPRTVPDGIAFNIDGTLYIACYRPDCIYTLDLDGQLEVFAEDYQGTEIGAPTNVAFGGNDLKTLFIASLARWHVGAMDVNIAGLPLHYPNPISLMGENS